jgi:hypothetical protein
LKKEAIVEFIVIFAGKDERVGGRYEEDSPVSSPEGEPMDVGNEDQQSSYK